MSSQGSGKRKRMGSGSGSHLFCKKGKLEGERLRIRSPTEVVLDVYHSFITLSPEPRAARRGYPGTT